MNISKILLLAILAILTFNLSGCIVIPANGYGGQTQGVYQPQPQQIVQPAQVWGGVYQQYPQQGVVQAPPCNPGTYDTGQRNPTGGRVCAYQRRMSSDGDENDTDVPVTIEI